MAHRIAEAHEGFPVVLEPHEPIAQAFGAADLIALRAFISAARLSFGAVRVAMAIVLNREP